MYVSFACVLVCLCCLECMPAFVPGGCVCVAQVGTVLATRSSCALLRADLGCVLGSHRVDVAHLAYPVLPAMLVIRVCGIAPACCCYCASTLLFPRLTLLGVVSPLSIRTSSASGCTDDGTVVPYTQPVQAKVWQIELAGLRWLGSVTPFRLCGSPPPLSSARAKRAVDRQI